MSQTRPPGPPPPPPPPTSAPSGQRQPPPPPPPPILCATTETLPGYRVDRYLGMCFGSVVRSLGFARSFTGGFKAMSEGEIPEYTQTVEQTRAHAMARMIEQARSWGANAVIAIRFDSSDIGQGVAEVIAYGTAVQVTPLGG